MRVRANSVYGSLSFVTKNLLTRMLSPLCGIDHEIGFMLHSSRDANVIIAGAEMTGVHTLLNLPRPGLGAYHLGGCGIHLNEAIIRTLGETVERYSQMTSEISGLVSSHFLSFQSMISQDEKTLQPEKMNYFIAQQYYQKNFPFDPLFNDQPLTWVKLNSLLRRDYLWVPAQLVFVGYKIKRNNYEPWIAPAVTTGTAAHTNANQALINAILELIQIDSAMGHWYSSLSALCIQFDHRTQHLERLLDKYCGNQKHAFSFYWLKNPDLPGFCIACVYRSEAQVLPQVVVGLGCELNLTEAMYKAFLEAVGIIGLARMVIFDKSYHLQQKEIDATTIYDLDTNVAYYALGHQRDLIEKKFPVDMCIPASELPADVYLTQENTVKMLLHAFAMSYKELLFYDLSASEAKDLGFVVPRVWSPDLLSLSLPSAAYLNHPRYHAYGGVHHDYPHPYP